VDIVSHPFPCGSTGEVYTNYFVVQRFHSRRQHACKIIETKGNFDIQLRKEFAAIL